MDLCALENDLWIWRARNAGRPALDARSGPALRALRPSCILPTPTHPLPFLRHVAICLPQNWCFVRLRFQTARRPAATSLPSLIVPWNRRSACPLYSSCRNVVFLLHCPPSLSPLLLHAHLSSLCSNDSVSVAAAARPGYYHHCSRAASCRCGFCNRCQLLLVMLLYCSHPCLSAMPLQCHASFRSLHVLIDAARARSLTQQSE